MTTLQKLAFALILSLYALPAHATTWYTNANLDFISITTVSHNSVFISSVAYFSIIGRTAGSAYGVTSGIQGVYSSQDQTVMQRCLAVAEQVNLSRRTGSTVMLRIQVQPDPANSGFAQIQYCTL
jgi:hypothetical protein